MLGQIGLGFMETRWSQSRDLCVTVGRSTGNSFEPTLKMATGLIALAEDVAMGEIDVAWVNPSGLLTQAYRGQGLFNSPLDLRVLGVFPSLDRFACVIHPRTGIRSLDELKQKQYPLKLSIRGDASHGTRVLLDQGFTALGMSVSDIERWGGQLVYCTSPHEEARMEAIRSNAIDAIFDEGIGGWLPRALASGYEVLDLGDTFVNQLETVGWRRAVLPAQGYAGLKADRLGIDFSGWAMYTRSSLEDDLASRFLTALAARESEMPWEDSYQGLGHLGQDTASTPRDVPLHPGARRWYEEHGYKVGE
jgi:TRAP-type uncharacterized transport system substrate-binding protein